MGDSGAVLRPSSSPIPEETDHGPVQHRVVARGRGRGRSHGGGEALPGRPEVRGYVHPRRHRLGVLAQGGRVLPRAHHRLAETQPCRHVRGHHFQARERRRSGTGTRAERPRSHLPQPHRPHAADVRPLHLPAPLQGLSRQSPELQGRHRHGGLQGEHRGSLCRRRIQPGAR